MHNSSQVLSQYFETHEGDAVIDNKNVLAICFFRRPFKNQRYAELNRD